MDKEPRTLASLRQIRYNGAKNMKEVPKMEQNDHNLDNTPLLRAIARMQAENSRESREAVLDLIIAQAQFLAPADIVPETEGKEAALRFQLLTNQEGQPFFPAFTGWEELRKLCGPKNQQTVVLTFDHYAGMVLRDCRAAGFVVDPMGACLTFDRNMMEHLVQRKQEMTK